MDATHLSIDINIGAGVACGVITRSASICSSQAQFQQLCGIAASGTLKNQITPADCLGENIALRAVPLRLTNVSKAKI